MLRVCRTDYFTRILIVTAMVWGFALPIAHLVCGMATEGAAILCDDQAVTDGAEDRAEHHAAGHEAPAPESHHAHAMPSPAEQHAHAAPGNAVQTGHDGHAALPTARHQGTQRGTDGPFPSAEFAAGDMSLECCWVDATAADRRAPLPSVTQLQDLAVAPTGVAPTAAVGETLASKGPVDSGSAPPIAFRFLFSVFLI